MYLYLQTAPFCSNQTTLFHLCQTTPFRLYQTAFRLCQHQLSLISATTLFLSQQQTSNSTTYCYQHVHFFNLLITYFVYLLPTTSTTIPHFTTICFSNSTNPFINHFFSLKLTILIVLSPTDFLSPFILPEFFLVRLAIFIPSLQGEPCRGSSHPSSR